MGSSLSDVLARKRAAKEAAEAERAARRHAKEQHDAQFITVAELPDRLRIGGLDRFDKREALFEVLRADMTPLYCRWAAWNDWTDGRDERYWHPDDARWVPLPPCPVVCFYRLKEGSDANWGQSYTHINRSGQITTPDPLLSACGLGWKLSVRGGMFSGNALAIRIEDAERLFGDAFAPVPAEKPQAVEPAAAVALNALVAIVTAPVAAPAPAPRAGTADAKETPEARQDRRLAELRGMGADFVRKGVVGETTGRRGALADLVRLEKQRGNPVNEKDGIRLDLMAAVERELERKRNGTVSR